MVCYLLDDVIKGLLISWRFHAMKQLLVAFSRREEEKVQQFQGVFSAPELEPI